MVGIPKVYRELYTTKKPIVLLTGGRGSGKTFNSSLFVSRISYERNHVILHCRYTMTSALDSVIPSVCKKLELDGTRPDFKVRKKDLVNIRSGSQILFRGIKTSSGNQTAKLKDVIDLSVFVCDEGEEWRSEEEFDIILGTVRSKLAQNMVLVVMNPCDIDHFLYQKYIKDTHKIVYYDGVPVQISTHPDVLHIHTTYMDNAEHLSKDWLDRVDALRDIHFSLPKEKQLLSKYARLYIGRWADRREGVIFEKWEQGKFDDSLPYGYGLDYGYNPDPLALIKVAVDKRKKRIYMKQMLYGTKITDEAILSYLQEKISKRDLIVCDHNEERTTDKIRRAGYNIRKADKGKGSVASDIRDMSDYTLIVDDSPDIETELNNYIWNDKKASIPIDAYNHSLDASRYIFRRLLSPRISASYS